MSDTSKTYDIAIHWFRNGLRFHDNPSLLDASKSCRTLIPLVIIDPEYPFCQTADRRAGCIRVNFILESLTELQNKLEMMGSQLMVVRGPPEQVLPDLVQQFHVQAIYYEREPAEPIRTADAHVLQAVRNGTKTKSKSTTIGSSAPHNGIMIHGYDTHTLHPIEQYVALCKDGTAPSTYGGFLKIFQRLQHVPAEVATVQQVPPLPDGWDDMVRQHYHNQVGIPSLEDLGYDPTELRHRHKSGIDFVGGEDAGLVLLETMMKRSQWVATFEKPKTSPNALTVDTTGLSPCT